MFLMGESITAWAISLTDWQLLTLTCHELDPDSCMYCEQSSELLPRVAVLSVTIDQSPVYNTCGMFTQAMAYASQSTVGL